MSAPRLRIAVPPVAERIVRERLYRYGGLCVRVVTLDDGSERCEPARSPSGALVKISAATSWAPLPKRWRREIAEQARAEKEAG